MVAELEGTAVLQRALHHEHRQYQSTLQATAACDIAVHAAAAALP